MQQNVHKNTHKIGVAFCEMLQISPKRGKMEKNGCNLQKSVLFYNHNEGRKRRRKKERKKKMKTYERSKQWFEREYKALRADKSCRITKERTSESYMTEYAIYDLYFDENGNYQSSVVSELNGDLIATYILRTT